jgi:hypothetical protein
VNRDEKEQVLSRHGLRLTVHGFSFLTKLEGGEHNPGAPLALPSDILTRADPNDACFFLSRFTVHGSRS